MKTIEIIFLCVCFSLGTLLILQGLFQFELIPLSLIGGIIGMDIYSPISFFVIPLVYFIFRFIFLFFGGPFIFKNKILYLQRDRVGLPPNFPSDSTVDVENSGSITRRYEYFSCLMSDFFIWAISMWLSFMLSGLLVTMHYIPNKDPPLFFVILNFYMGFFILVKIIKITLFGYLRGEIDKIFIK